jgi:hypothetical protein
LHRAFRNRPCEYEKSEAYFRVLVMVTVVQRDMGVTYDPGLTRHRPEGGDFPWASSREVFLHGPLSPDRNTRHGTCANLPVLFAAIGRSLGYPIYLCLARGHVFCRWHDAVSGERFNIEASGRGLNVYPDEHYTRWPYPIPLEEVSRGNFLRNLDPPEELSTFMLARGQVLEDAGYLLDAITCYAHAHRLAPVDPVAWHWLGGAIGREAQLRREGKLPECFRDADADLASRGLWAQRFVLTGPNGGPADNDEQPRTQQPA